MLAKPFDFSDIDERIGSWNIGKAWAMNDVTDEIIKNMGPVAIS